MSLRSARTWPWILLALMALLWPARITGAFDGLPLDTVPKAIGIGLVAPLLCWFHARFLRTLAARALIVLLFVLKAALALVAAPDGWCVRFQFDRPFARDAASAVPHSWDVRADWRSTTPACSAIMRRSYNGLGEFPVWFFNLPPPNDSLPEPADRPPGARTLMTVTGFLDVWQSGTLQIAAGRDMQLATYVDGVPLREGDQLTAGIHRVRIDAVLTGDRWRFVPTWNGADLWSRAIATVSRPRLVDEFARPIGGWLVTTVAGLLLFAWVVSFIRSVGSTMAIAWSLAASGVLAYLAMPGHDLLDRAQWAVPGLAIAAMLRLPPRLRNVRGAFVLVGIPWLALVVASRLWDPGHFTLYSAGDDWWMFQRYGYRIALQGYWLEGGTVTFHFQPFYRWVNAVLHLVFGDSSVGEVYWDGACLMAGALLAFRVTKTAAGFRWGIVAAVLMLAVVALGNPWGFIGRGLGEITSTGFLAVAAFLALRGRRGPLVYAVAAGLLATLAFYTRLNNLLMAFGVGVFALSARVPVRRLTAPAVWRRGVAWRTLATVAATIVAGIFFMAWRNWHYSGVFHPLHGTETHLLLWKKGMPLLDSVRASFDSALMVLTVHDPPAFDWKTVPVLAGAVAALLSLVGVPRLRALPAAPVLFLISGIAGGFLARGQAYAGRFSIHVIGICCAVAVMALATVVPRRRR